MSYNIIASQIDSITKPKGATSPWGPNDAPILIVLGQSNSYGHATTLPAGEQITTAYANVLTLDRTASSNALYNANVGASAIAWTGLTSFGRHNIATTSTALGAQDHTCNAANQLARLWQAHITAGNAMGLPNLYTILMGWGSQGIDASLAASGVDRWSPERDATNVESLYSRSIKTLYYAIQNLRDAGKNPRILAVHWNQWESEAGFTDAASFNSLKNFQKIVAGINDALGSDEVPWRFFYPLATVYTAPRTARVVTAINSLVKSDPIRFSLLDTRTAPHYTGTSPAFGIFGGDNVHYNITTQKWFGQKEWDRVLEGWKGVTLSETKGKLPAFLQSNVSVVNDLTTGGATVALSAEQGKILNTLIPKTTEWEAFKFNTGVVANTTTNQLAATTLRTTPGYVYQIETVVNATTGKKVFLPVATSGTGTNGGQVLLVANATPTDGKFGYFEWEQVGNPSVSICLAVKSRTVANTYNSLGYGYFALWIDALYTGKPIFSSIGITAAGTTHDTGTPFAMVWDLANMGAGNTGIRVMPFTGTPTAGVYSGTPTITATPLTNQAKPLITGWSMTTLVKWRAGLLAANNGTLTVEWYDTATSTWKVAIQQQNMNTIRTVGNNFDSGQLGLLYGMSSTANNSVANMNLALSGARMTNIFFKSDD
jgi:hypothetical protein